jgi:hypothetical protein
MAASKLYWIRNITPILYRFRGQHHRLIAELENLSVQGLEDLYRLLQNIEQDLHTAERTFRPFPGGPRMRF